GVEESVASLVLHKRKALEGSVHLVRRRVDDGRTLTSGSSGFEDVERADEGCVQVETRVLDREGDRRLSSKVIDDLNVLHCRRHSIRVTNVTVDEAKRVPVPLAQPIQIDARPGPREVVEESYRRAAPDEGIADVRADEPGASGDQAVF